MQRKQENKLKLRWHRGNTSRSAYSRGTWFKSWPEILIEIFHGFLWNDRIVP
jgi:hypothetical protein